MNGTTNNDRTLYYEVLPKNQLDMGLFLEADRMRSLRVTKENLDNQRQAVKEERRLGVDNQPYGQTFEKIDELVYDNFAYQHSVIGSMDDLDAASVEDVQQFFRTYYAPNNAVIALVGDLDTKETLAKVKKYSATFRGRSRRAGGPHRAAKRRPSAAPHGRQAGARGPPRHRVQDSRRRPTPETRALSWRPRARRRRKFAALSEAGEGEGSRPTSAPADARRAGPVACSRSPAWCGPAKTPEEVEGADLRRDREAHAEPVTEKELKRVRTGIRRGRSARGRARSRGRQRWPTTPPCTTIPTASTPKPEKQHGGDGGQVQEAAKAYLREANRVVIVTDPAAARCAPGAPQAAGTEEAPHEDMPS